MDLNAVNIFISVAETGSLSAASRKLDLPVSTISRRIQALEKQLDARLMERSTRRMQLTLAGEDLYDSCVSAISALKDAESSLTNRRDLPSGVVRIVLPRGYSQYLFLPLIQRFRRYYPDISIRIASQSQDNDLISGAADILFCTEPQDDHRSVAKPLIEFRHQLVCAPSYKQQVVSLEQPEDLLQYDCILYGAACKPGVWLLERKDQSTSTSRILPPDETVFDCYSLVQEAIVAGMGIGELPSLMAGPLCEQGLLVPLMPEWTMKKSSLDAIIPSHRQLTRAARVFMDFIEEYLSSAINWPLV
ncbi:LysR family transcriptional regulator [Sansalvadorimonas sp. 2012CJ34-2]|uniref:LysR family transcriptional regulator n=1 Tax=Parendozoicomonas callyspongiae TaxID=2942213 RepID=A0ABT0PKD5_9GAMM|nr:LysR family transcriptional regulator [Sansalvadorimonas sp. 2012CJ34-2]MCL6271436.1 LysR family transcriptional regulator [Sansalvadorimonas sp. 2012CJ34-2]